MDSKAELKSLHEKLLKTQMHKKTNTFVVLTNWMLVPLTNSALKCLLLHLVDSNRALTLLLTVVTHV